MEFDILGPALKFACCYLGAANAAAEVVQVVLPRTSILQLLAARRLIPVQWHALLCVLKGPSLCSSHAGCTMLFPLFVPSITLSLLGSLSFRRTNHLNKFF